MQLDTSLNKLKGFRTMAGLTQIEMAKKVGMSERTYVTKENDIKKFTVNELNLVVQILNEAKVNIKISDLF